MAGNAGASSPLQPRSRPACAPTTPIDSVPSFAGFLWEIPVLASAAMVPVVLLWASLARALSAVTNFFFWYNNSVPTGFHKLDGRARAKAVIDWAQFMQTFFENGPSLIVQIIFVIISESPVGPSSQSASHVWWWRPVEHLVSPPHTRAPS